MEEAEKAIATTNATRAEAKPKSIMGVIGRAIRTSSMANPLRDPITRPVAVIIPHRIILSSRVRIIPTRTAAISTSVAVMPAARLTIMRGGTMEAGKPDRLRTKSLLHPNSK